MNFSPDLQRKKMLYKEEVAKNKNGNFQNVQRNLRNKFSYIWGAHYFIFLNENGDDDHNDKNSGGWYDNYGDNNK